MQPPVAKVSTAASTVKAAAMTERLTLLTENILAPPAPSDTNVPTTLQVLKLPALVSLAKKDPTLASQIASIKTQTTAAPKDAQAKQTQYQTALTTMLQSAMNLLKPHP